MRGIVRIATRGSSARIALFAELSQLAIYEKHRLGRPHKTMGEGCGLVGVNHYSRPEEGFRMKEVLGGCAPRGNAASDFYLLFLLDMMAAKTPTSPETVITIPMTRPVVSEEAVNNMTPVTVMRDMATM